MSTSQPDRSQDWLGQPLYVDLDENPRLYVDLTTPYVVPSDITPPPLPDDPTVEEPTMLATATSEAGPLAITTEVAAPPDSLIVVSVAAFSGTVTAIANSDTPLTWTVNSSPIGDNTNAVNICTAKAGSDGLPAGSTITVSISSASQTMVGLAAAFPGASDVVNATSGNLNGRSVTDWDAGLLTPVAANNLLVAAGYNSGETTTNTFTNAEDLAAVSQDDRTVAVGYVLNAPAESITLAGLWADAANFSPAVAVALSVI
jgi:hypothetical protein